MNILKKFGRACAMWAMVSVSGLVLVACAGNSTPSTFYMLRSMESPQESLSGTAKDTASVLVGPITLPAYLDRNQMVTVVGNNEVTLDEFNRWAESLRDSFYRVLLEDLSLLLKTPEVYGYDRSGSNGSDYQVTIDVTRFDCAPRGDAVLTAFWTVKGKEGGASGITKKSVFRAAVSSTGFSGMVEAQNRTLAAFSREIASAIKGMRNVH